MVGAEPTIAYQSLLQTTTVVVGVQNACLFMSDSEGNVVINWVNSIWENIGLRVAHILLLYSPKEPFVKSVLIQCKDVMPKSAFFYGSSTIFFNIWNIENVFFQSNVSVGSMDWTKGGVRSLEDIWIEQ